MRSAAGCTASREPTVSMRKHKGKIVSEQEAAQANLLRF
jgi:hypothetical protein